MNPARLARRNGRALLVVLGAIATLALAAPAAATVITAFPVDFSVAEHTVFNGAVATFEDDNPAAVPSDFTAPVDGGDGTPVDSNTTIASNSSTFVVLTSDTYSDECVCTATMTISDE